MQVTLRANGQIIEFEYVWVYEGKLQSGIMLLSGAPESNTASGVWTDSWHSAHTLMMLAGKIDSQGNADLKGRYTVPDNPDWGWRITVAPGDATLTLAMKNVSPEGAEDPAVEAIYFRA